MKKCRVIIIDAVKAEVREGEVTDLASCQAIVDGKIEAAHTFENGDRLYVNEEGMLGSPRYFFKMKGAYSPFAGSAYIIGSGARGSNANAASDLEEISESIDFIDMQADKKESIMLSSDYIKQRRLEIALTLLQGHVVERPRDGYDPMRSFDTRVRSLVDSALHIADQLIKTNESFGKENHDDEN